MNHRSRQDLFGDPANPRQQVLLYILQGRSKAKARRISWIWLMRFFSNLMMEIGPLGPSKHWEARNGLVRVSMLLRYACYMFFHYTIRTTNAGFIQLRHCDWVWIKYTVRVWKPNAIGQVKIRKEIRRRMRSHFGLEITFFSAVEKARRVQ